MQLYKKARSPNNVRKQCKGGVKYGRHTSKYANMQNLINSLVNLRTIFMNESFHVITNYFFFEIVKCERIMFKQ